jgi:hypothetical protein
MKLTRVPFEIDAAPKRSPRPTQPAARRTLRLGALLKALSLLSVAALLLPEATPFPNRPSPERPADSNTVEQYRAGGARWLDSNHQEVVHFFCHPGTPYRISLNSVGLLSAGIDPAEQTAYLEALREAARDWSDRMRCPWIRVELDGVDPNTRVVLAFIDRPGTLAVATRAGDITLNAGRDWFPGSKRQGNYDEHGRRVSFYWVIAHELGHVWGLAHSESPDSLMNASQCDTCRWSSFEQAAANVIHATSLMPSWSRPHYSSRFFARTPIEAIAPLLTGELPDEVRTAQRTRSHCEPEMCTSMHLPALAPNRHPDCETADPYPTSALFGWPALAEVGRSLRELAHRRVVPAPDPPPRRTPRRPGHSPLPRAILQPVVLPTDPPDHLEVPWSLFSA